MVGRDLSQAVTRLMGAPSMKNNQSGAPSVELTCNTKPRIISCPKCFDTENSANPPLEARTDGGQGTRCRCSKRNAKNDRRVCCGRNTIADNLFDPQKWLLANGVPWNFRPGPELNGNQRSSRTRRACVHACMYACICPSSLLGRE